MVAGWVGTGLASTVRGAVREPTLHIVLSGSAEYRFGRRRQVAGPGAYCLNDGDPYRFSVTDAALSLMSGVTLLDSGLSKGGTALALPDFASGSTDRGYFGPNFQVADAVTVPEPGSLALLGVGISRDFLVPMAA